MFLNSNLEVIKQGHKKKIIRTPSYSQYQSIKSWFYPHHYKTKTNPDKMSAQGTSVLAHLFPPLFGVRHFHFGHQPPLPGPQEHSNIFALKPIPNHRMPVATYTALRNYYIAPGSLPHLLHAFISSSLDCHGEPAFIVCKDTEAKFFPQPSQIQYCTGGGVQSNTWLGS